MLVGFVLGFDLVFTLGSYLVLFVCLCLVFGSFVVIADCDCLFDYLTLGFDCLNLLALLFG